MEKTQASPALTNAHGVSNFPTATAAAAKIGKSIGSTGAGLSNQTDEPSGCTPLPAGALLQTALGDWFTGKERNLCLQTIDRVARDLNSSCVTTRLVEKRRKLALLNVEI